MEIETPKRIFINPTYGIGDLIMLLPLLHSLKESEVEIGLFSSKRQSPLAEAITHLVDMQFAQMGSSTRMGHFHALLAAIYFNPQVVLLLSRSRPLAFASNYLNFRTIVASNRGPLSKLNPYNIKSLTFQPGTHRVDINMGALDYLGLGSQIRNFEFNIPNIYEEQARKIVNALDLRGDKVIGIVPRSRFSFKDWPEKSLEETIKILTYDLGHTVVLLDNAKTKEYCFKGVVDLREKTSFLIDAYILRYSGLLDLVVGVDTGMMHLTGSISTNGNREVIPGTPRNLTVSIFGDTDPRVFAPYDATGNYNTVVSPDQPPSYKGGYSKRIEAMGQIGHQKIVYAIADALAKKSTPILQSVRA